VVVDKLQYVLLPTSPCINSAPLQQPHHQEVKHTISDHICLRKSVQGTDRNTVTCDSNALCSSQIAFLPNSELVTCAVKYNDGINNKQVHIIQIYFNHYFGPRFFEVMRFYCTPKSKFSFPFVCDLRYLCL
jgi:hypothetical protein